MTARPMATANRLKRFSGSASQGLREWPIFIDEGKEMTDIQTNSASKKLDDPDIRLAETALRRTALKAHERARRSGHGIIIYDRGSSIRIS